MNKTIINCTSGVVTTVALTSDEVVERTTEIANAVPYVEPDTVVFNKPIVAPDFIVQSPKVKDDPKAALVEAVAEARKAHGDSKSIALIVLSLAHYLDDVEKRLTKAKL